MKPSPTSPKIPLFFIAILSLIALSFSFIAFDGNVSSAQGQVQVNAADPTLAEQGTINLNVRVTGKGFKNGARAQWFVTGTTNPGGVTVNSTTFVSSTQVTANLTVADTASIANFDIQVLNSDGRGGKGTELFRVTAKNQVLCPPMQPPPTGDTKCYAGLPGCLDATFAGIGFLHTDLDSLHNAANGLVVQLDGKIVVVSGARSSPTASFDFAVIRYNVDGTLDTSFGDLNPLNPPLRRGFTVTSLTTGHDGTYGVALQLDGKIVVVGSPGDVDSGAVVRYNVDGTLDASFGNGGIALLDFGRRNGAPNHQVAIQEDGKIVIGGSARDGFAVARLLQNGSPDASFGSGGLVMANPGGKTGAATGWSIAIQRVPAISGEERIVIGGESRTSSQSFNKDWTLMRFKANGATDTTFGVGGIVKTPFTEFGAWVNRVEIDSSNRIVAVGKTRTADVSCGGYTIDYAVARYTENGSIDSSFAGGKQTIDIYGGMDNLYALAIQTDDKIVMAGYADSSDGSVTNFALVRLNVDGSRDSSFGLLGNGVVTTDLYGFDDNVIGVALDPNNGRIIVTGSADFGPGTTTFGDVVVARYLP